MTLRLILSLSGLLAVLPVISAQETTQTARGAAEPAISQAPAPTVLTVRPSKVTLPEGNGVWVVLIRRSGGFAGVSLEVSVNSERKLNCTLCKNDQVSRSLTETALQSVTPSFSFGIAPLNLELQSDTTSAALPPAHI